MDKLCLFTWSCSTSLNTLKHPWMASGKLPKQAVMVSCLQQDIHAPVYQMYHSAKHQVQSGEEEHLKQSNKIRTFCPNTKNLHMPILVTQNNNYPSSPSWSQGRERAFYSITSHQQQPWRYIGGISCREAIAHKRISPVAAQLQTGAHQLRRDHL